MKYNFDEIIHRENTSSVKYDLRESLFGKKDVMPLWVADMDFATPPFIREAVIERATHPVYGYTFRGQSFNTSVIEWMGKRHDWKIKKEWISFSPGVVPALNMLVLTFTNKGDGVMIQSPVYFPFFNAVEDHQRKLINNQLVYNGGRYEIDFEDFEEKARESKIFILCHPHNPVARVWTKPELEKMVKICHKHNVIIISDEIHSDLVLNAHRHIPLPEIENAEEVTISCYAPSKTFNLAGLATSFLVIPNKKLRSRYEKTLNEMHIGMGNLFGFTALEAAYKNGDEWLEELITYLEENIAFLENFLKEKLPEIKLVPPEATYLMWLDFKGLGLNERDLRKFIIGKAGLGLNDGPSFGPGGSGFQRINIALPKVKLEEALEKLEKAVTGLRNS